MGIRTITDHIVEGDSVNHQLHIAVADEPGPGGASHSYGIYWERPTKNDPAGKLYIKFKKGPIAECNVNGVTHEALIAIVIDRLRSFQAGPYACDQNEAALDSLERALFCLQARTKARIARGVEGTHEK